MYTIYYTMLFAIKQIYCINKNKIITIVMAISSNSKKKETKQELEIKEENKRDRRKEEYIF
jgi:hypothetical protein